MIKLGSLSLQDTILCGRHLQRCGKESDSMEDFACNVVVFLYENFIGPEGEKAFSLVRYFYTYYIEIQTKKEK